MVSEVLGDKITHGKKIEECMQETKNEFKFLAQHIRRESSSRGSKQNRVREGKGFKKESIVSQATGKSSSLRIEMDS